MLAVVKDGMEKNLFPMNGLIQLYCMLFKNLISIRFKFCKDELKTIGGKKKKKTNKQLTLIITTLTVTLSIITTIRQILL